MSRRHWRWLETLSCSDESVCSSAQHSALFSSPLSHSQQVPLSVISTFTCECMHRCVCVCVYTYAFKGPVSKYRHVLMFWGAKASTHKPGCCMHAKSLQSCPTVCDLVDCSPPGPSVHGDSPGKNTGADCHALLQGILPTQRWSLHLLRLLHRQAGSLAPQGTIQP